MTQKPTGTRNPPPRDPAEILKAAADQVAAWRAKANAEERDRRGNPRDRCDSFQFGHFGRAEGLRAAADQLEDLLGLAKPVDPIAAPELEEPPF